MNPFIQHRLAWWQCQQTEQLGFEAVQQPGLNGRKSYQPRGKTMRSSSINAMMYARGHRYDYDTWKAWVTPNCRIMNRVCLTLRRQKNNEVHQDEYHITVVR
ncbi:GMC family oxidoreductase N-terminal domain-containing protein [Vibrio lentus]|nr:GMC family oxidoreductase N-terminal domain-containing protein [Vibrio lentus]